MQAYGYNFEYRILNAADFGAYTSRRRYFAQFMRSGLPIAWPAATHSKKPGGGGLFNALQPWRPVKDVLDFEDEGQSIFIDLYPKTFKGAKKYLSAKVKSKNRKQPKRQHQRIVVAFPVAIKSPVFGMEPKLILGENDLPEFEARVSSFQALYGTLNFYRYDPYSEQTYARVYAGLIKYIAGGKDAFIAKYFSGKPEGKVIPVDGPAGTVTTVDGQALVLPVSILKYNSMSRQGVHVPPSVEQPAPTLACQGRIGVVQAAFLTNYYSNGWEIGSVEAPACTISTRDRTAKVQACWLDKNYSGAHNHQSITQPAGAILTNDKHAIVRTERAFLMGTNYDNKPTSLFAPAPTITASRKWSYLVNPSWGGHPTGTDQPSPVIVARQDKAPMYLVQTDTGKVGIPIYETDSACIVKIKEFMAAYGIVDIKMRMQKIPELLRIQGFGDGYLLKGTQADQKRFIGNAVEVNQARVLIEASYRAIMEQSLLKIA